MEQNSDNSNSNNSIFHKIKKTVNAILWDLPFDNYHSFYKTGEIHKMDIEQKKNIIYKESNLKLKKMFFARLIGMRPTILDDEDYTEFNNILARNKKEKAIVILGFFGLNAWTFYMVSIKHKTKFFGKFLFFNFLLIICLYYSNNKLQSFYDKMFVKYDKEIINAELEEKINMVYKKD